MNRKTLLLSLLCLCTCFVLSGCLTGDALHDPNAPPFGAIIADPNVSVLDKLAVLMEKWQLEQESAAIILAEINAKITDPNIINPQLVKEGTTVWTNIKNNPYASVLTLAALLQNGWLAWRRGKK